MLRPSSSEHAGERTADAQSDATSEAVPLENGAHTSAVTGPTSMQEDTDQTSTGASGALSQGERTADAASDAAPEAVPFLDEGGRTSAATGRQAGQTSVQEDTDQTNTGAPLPPLIEHVGPADFARIPARAKVRKGRTVWEVVGYVLLALVMLLMLLVGLTGFVWVPRDHQVLFKIREGLCWKYGEEYSVMGLEPWKPKGQKQRYQPIKGNYIPRKFVSARAEKRDSLIEFFNFEDAAKRRRVVLVAEQGWGKTAETKKVALDWCAGINYGVPTVGERLKLAVGHWRGYVPSWSALGKFFLAADYFDFFGFYIPVSRAGRTEVRSWFDESGPILVVAFELRHILGYKTLAETITKEALTGTSVTADDVERTLSTWSRKTLLVFDGYDEYSYGKVSAGTAPEVQAIMHAETRASYNLLVTSRSWKADQLSPASFAYTIVEIQPLRKQDYVTFIENYFTDEWKSAKLVEKLKSGSKVVPTKMLQIPRMLLCICWVWEKRPEAFDNHDLFNNEIWGLMHKTYNVKYPDKVMSDATVQQIRSRFQAIGKKGKGALNMGMDEFHGSEHSEALFALGMYLLDQGDDEETPEVMAKPVIPETLMGGLSPLDFMRPVLDGVYSVLTYLCWPFVALVALNTVGVIKVDWS